jgi:hypothetical protein
VQREEAFPQLFLRNIPQHCAGVAASMPRRFLGVLRAEPSLPLFALFRADSKRLI